MVLRRVASPARALPLVTLILMTAACGAESEEGSFLPSTGAPDAATRDAGGGAREPDSGGFLPPVVSGDSGAPDGSPACVAVENKATIVKKPIDFIVLPDESNSMGNTRNAVASAMENQVKNALDRAGIDYRVVWHGSWPLPTLGSKVFYNSVALGSGASTMFKPVLDTFGNWVPKLRADALKVFVQFTDGTSGDGGSISGFSGSFDDVLISRDPGVFGTSAARKFTHHVFAGIREKSPPTDPWLPADAVVGTSCGTSYKPVRPLEDLARRNGGYRFPLCRPDLFAGVFERIAQTAIAEASVSCDLLIPEPPPGVTLNFSTVAVRYTAGDGTVKVLLRAANAAACAPDRFLLDEQAKRVTLCPAACSAVKADAKAKLSLLSGCDPKVY